MRPELSITFSPGQEPPSDGNQSTSAAVSADNPIYFGTRPFLGASQVSTSEGTFSPAQASLEPGSLTESRNPRIPSGATVPPRLRLAVSGVAPTLKTRQLWEGTVTEVDEGGFVAVLSDMTNPRNPDEQVSFYNTEISPDDLRLINPGATFYWVIGNERTVAGQVKNVSMVQFRRVPAWTQRRLERAADRARRLLESF